MSNKGKRKPKRSGGRKPKSTRALNRGDQRELTDQLVVQLGNTELPGDAGAFAEAIFQRYDNVLRFRRDVDPRCSAVQPEPLPWYRLAYRATEASHRKSVRFSRTLDYAAGDFFLQDAGSLLALAVGGADTNALAGQLVCDLCAAPGGKASALAEATTGVQAEGWGANNGPRQPGFLLANEPIRSRLGPLKFNLARTGSDRYAISQLDPDELAARLPGIFDVVLVDAPCSGQALVGRGKQQLASLSSKQIEHSAARQRRILQAALRLLKPGGRLVYSTCTFAEMENESQVQYLLETSPLIADPIESLAEYETQSGCYRLWPHRDHCAGSFAASLKLAEDENRNREPDEASMPGSNEAIDRARCHRSIEEVLSQVEPSFLLDRSRARMIRSESVLNIWPVDVPSWVESIASAGPELAYRTHQVWKPAHHAALLRGDNSVAQPTQNIGVDDAQAAAFLRGEPVACSEAGWCRVMHRDRPLGWVKGDGEIGKNQLPAAGRMEVSLE